MAPKEALDPLQLILSQLAELKAGNDALKAGNDALKAGNEALREDLARQDARHREDLATLRKDFETRLAAHEVVASSTKTATPRPGEASPTTVMPEGGSWPTSGTPQVTPTDPSAPFTKSDRLPDPPMFSGKRIDLSTFVRKLRYKLEGNADRYPTERARLLYAHSRLERDPVTLIDPLMDKDICTVDQLVSFLQATYGDPNKEITAWSKLDNLKQGKRSFLTHFAEFRRLVADTELNEAGMISHLRRTLSDDLRRAMIGIPIPGTLNEYANLISTYDNDLRYLPVTRASKSYAHQKDPNAMEIDATDYAPLHSAERQKRIQDGRCFKCGHKGHISRDCSVPLPQIRVRNSSPSNRTNPRHHSRRRSVASSATSSCRSRSRSRSRSLPHHQPAKAPSRG